MMETLAAIGFVGNVIRFVDFSGKIILKSGQLYQSSEGALAENTTNDLVLLNNKPKDAATSAGDGALEKLCRSCSTFAEEFLDALDKVYYRKQVS